MRICVEPFIVASRTASLRGAQLQIGVTIVLASVILTVLWAASPAARAQAAELQTGDLLIVRPLSGIDKVSGGFDSDRWRSARDRFVRDAPLSATREFRTWSYEEFLLHFQGGIEDPSAIGEVSGIFSLAASHIAFVENAAEGIFVIDVKRWGKVRRTPLVDWFREFAENSRIEIYRLSSFDADQRSAIVAAADNRVDTSHSFFNLDLSDASSFYNAKLIWYAVKVVTGVPIDGVQRAQRGSWLSPKTIIKSRHVERAGTLEDATFGKAKDAH